MNIFRSSQRRCSLKKVVLKIFANFIEKDLCSIKVATLRHEGLQRYQKETQTLVLSCEICDIFRNIYFEELLHWTAWTFYSRITETLKFFQQWHKCLHKLRLQSQTKIKYYFSNVQVSNIYVQRTLKISFYFILKSKIRYLFIYLLFIYSWQNVLFYMKKCNDIHGILIYVNFLHKHY